MNEHKGRSYLELMEGASVRVARFCINHHWGVLALALGLSLLAGLGATRLRIDRDFKVLLPSHFPSVARLERLIDRGGNQSDLMFVIRSPEAARTMAVAEDLAGRLEGMYELRYVLFHQDTSFLRRNALLFLSVEELEKLEGEVRGRIQREVERSLDLLDDEDTTAADGGGGKDPFRYDEESLLKRFGIKGFTEQFMADEGRLLVIKARPREPTSNMAFSDAMMAKVSALVREARARAPEGVRITIEGHYKEHSQELKAIKGDVFSSALICLLLLMGVMGAYFRKVRAVAIIFLPLLMSVVWSLGIAYLVYGYLNLVSAFIFGILLGLGIDYGIHVLARYRECRAEGMGNEEALVLSLRTTGVSVSVGAFTSAVAFLLLLAADFKGFSQFGLLSGVGVLLALTATFTVLPAVTTAFEGLRPWRSGKAPAKKEIIRPASQGRMGAVAVAVVVISAVTAIVAASQAPKIEFEYDLNKLGSAPKAQGPARETDFREALEEHATLAPAVAMGSTLAETEAVYRTLRRVKDLKPSQREELEAARGVVELKDPVLVELGKIYPLDVLRLQAQLIGALSSVFTFIPEDQGAKMAVIQRIRQRVERKRNLFKGEQAAKVEEFLGYCRPGGVNIGNLPSWIRVQFQEADGQDGRFIIIRGRGSKSNIKDALRLKRAFFDLRGLDGANVATAATYFIMPEIVETIQEEGPMVVGLALLGLFCLLILHFRSLKAVALVLLPLTVSLLWLCGVMEILGLKLNFFNVIVFPLHLGMGVDHGVHLYSRYREEGSSNLGLVIRQTGTAVFLAAGTTMIGFGGLLFASQLGLRSLGTLAIAGMALALISALVTLPACLRVMELLRPNLPEGGGAIPAAAASGGQRRGER